MNRVRTPHFSLLAALVILSLLLAACQVPAAAPAGGQQAAATPANQEAAASSDNMTTIYGQKLPDDAVPYDQQIDKEGCSNTANMTAFDFQVTVYTRICGPNFSDALIDLDKDFKVEPAAAEKWEVSKDGLTWTFHLRPGQMWSDGTPLTAADWEATYQYMADPKHAWDFAWFYAGIIKNWDEVVAGEVPSTTLGVKAVDDLTLAITTKNPFPPLPGMMKFGWTLQKKALLEHGPFYNNDPKTSVSSSTWMLESIELGKKIVVVPNPKYKGYAPARMSRIEYTFMDPATYYESFKKGEIYQVGYEQLTPADFDEVMKDPVMSKNYLRHFGDFRTDYLTWDTYNKPFSDLNVRKAFAHAVDRDAILKSVYSEIKAMPAYGLLMPGFPSSSTKGELKEYQNYDCAAAKDYLAKAGYPDGKDFPKQELWLRNESPALQAVAQAVAASISQCLNVQIEVSNKDYKVYMDALNAKPTKLTLGMISYGMDYLDPANMLGIFVSTGRHSWKNEQYDKMIAEASQITDDLKKRDQMFRDAEKILVDDAGGLFLYHRWQGTLYQPFMQGDCFRKPDAIGITGPHWGDDSCGSETYIAKH